MQKHVSSYRVTIQRSKEIEQYRKKYQESLKQRHNTLKKKEKEQKLFEIQTATAKHHSNKLLNKRKITKRFSTSNVLTKPIANQT